MSSDRARFTELAQASRGVAAERGRKGKVARIAACVRSPSPSEAVIAATYSAGELRQGAVAGLIIEAIAAAAQTPVARARRAAMSKGDVAPVAQIAYQRPAICPGLACLNRD